MPDVVGITRLRIASSEPSALRSSFPPSRPVFPFLFTGPNWVWTSDWTTVILY